MFKIVEFSFRSIEDPEAVSDIIEIGRGLGRPQSFNSDMFKVKLEGKNLTEIGGVASEIQDQIECLIGGVVKVDPPFPVTQDQIPIGILYRSEIDSEVWLFLEEGQILNAGKFKNLKDWATEKVSESHWLFTKINADEYHFYSEED